MSRKRRLSVYLDVDVMKSLETLAKSRTKPKSLVAEAAIASFLSPDDAETREAAISRRLDRLSRQLERLERDIEVSNETLALFVRFWLTVTPPLPAEAQAAAQAKGKERYDGFIEALGRRMAKGKSLRDELHSDG